MSQRESGYERKERDLYETPEWVTAAVLPHLPPPPLGIWEPACGSGKMASVLSEHGDVLGTDIEQGHDFLFCIPSPFHRPINAIITNPPYVQAQLFIEKALAVMEPIKGLVAMLLRTDFDHAKTRQHLFSRHQAFAKKLVLTKRIRWFEESKGQPSFNHAWFIWDWRHSGPPVLAYGPDDYNAPKRDWDAMWAQPFDFNKEPKSNPA